MSDTPEIPETFTDFYLKLHELFHRVHDRAAAADYFKTAIDAHPEWMEGLKQAHAYAAQIVSSRGREADNGSAATYTMLQTLFDQFPELRR